MKTPLLSLLTFSTLLAQAEPPGNWKALDLENNKGTARFSVQEGEIVVTGAIESKQEKLLAADQANFDYTATLSIPEKPAQWASASLALMGKDNKDRSYAMVLFHPKNEVEVGFFGETMVKFPMGDARELCLRLQVSDGEQRFKVWAAGTPEPEEWNSARQIPFAEIGGVGLRTYAMDGRFKKVELVRDKVPAPPLIDLQGKDVKAAVHEQTGILKSLELNGKKIDLFQGNLGGPAFAISSREGATLTPKLKNVKKGEARFIGQLEGLDYTLEYVLDKGALAVKATVANKTWMPWSPTALKLNLGIDTCMISFPEWNKKHFPTFLRTEKTHFWGYAMSPEGSIVGMFSPDALPSWNLRYNNGGHRINGMQLELLGGAPLPDRAPQDNQVLAPGESKTWTVYLAGVNDLSEMPSAAAQYTGATFVTADRYTGEPGEQVKLTLTGTTPSGLTLVDAEGNSKALKIDGETASLTLPEQPGFYRVIVENKAGKTSEAMLTVRRPWSWYMTGSREWTVKAKQKAGSHVEGWYGFFPSFKIRHLIPDAELDKKLDADFDELFATMYDYEKKIPLGPALPHRIQNHACAASIFMEKYLCSGDIKDMEMASALCDFVIGTQKEDGAYRSGKTHYTCVIYVGKSLMEVMEVEKKLGQKDPVWKERYERHYDSVRRAMDELALHLDNIETEGEMTFEDGMISCSYTQLAAWARHFAKPEERAKYIDAAEKLVAKHRCLSQLVQPDSRMNGASLRFWESQYDVLWCPNFMNSPHGWSGWRLYGLFDLYRLTGKIDYLRQAMNGMGSSANLLNPVTGQLNWAFMTDPRITTDVFEQDRANPGKGIRVKRTLGETYVPVISEWWKAPYGKAVFGYGDGGGSCDNDVHEIFKCVAEHVLRITWLYVRENGEPEVWNGKVEKNGDTYKVTPSEKFVNEIHVNSPKPLKLEIVWKDKTESRDLPVGLSEVK